MDKFVIRLINKKEFEKADKVISDMDYNGLDTNELRIDLDIAISSELIKVEKEKKEQREVDMFDEARDNALMD